MSDDAVQAEIRAFLGRATRHGMYGSLATRAGLTLNSVYPGFRLVVEVVDQAIRDTTPVDVSSWINSLYVKRMERITLDAPDIFKLRALLLLGLGAARHLSGEERRLALARTYRINPQVGERSDIGVAQFRNRASDVYRAERELLLDEITRVVADTIDEVPLASGFHR